MNLHFAVLGAGAIGGTVGGLLHRTGLRTTLVARGAHLDRLRADGLWLRTPQWQARLDVPVADAVPADADVVLLAVKSHQTRIALGELPRHLPVVCLQNGIGNEPIAQSLGHPTIGAMVWVPAVHLDPGEVRSHGAPIPGAIDVGPYTPDTAALADAVSAALTLAGFASRVSPDIMALKRAKLLTNLGNAVQAACGEVPADVLAALQAEAQAIFAAHALPVAPQRAVVERVAIESAPIDGAPRPGGSTWQSVARGQATETYALHAPLIALARQARVAYPVLRRLTHIGRGLEALQSWTTAELRQALLDPVTYGNEFSVYDGLDAIRARPGMWLDGGTDDRAVQALFEGVIDELSVYVPEGVTDLTIDADADALRAWIAHTTLTPEAVHALCTQMQEDVSDWAVANALSARFVAIHAMAEPATCWRFHGGEQAATGSVVSGRRGLGIDLRLDREIVAGRFERAAITAYLRALAAEDGLRIRFNGEQIAGQR